MRGSFRSGFMHLIALCSILCGMCSLARGSESGVNFSAIISNGTCEISASSPSITFLSIAENAFSRPKQTSEIQPLVLTLEQCHGLGGGGAHASIRVDGNMATYDPHLFRDADSSAKGVGIMVRAEKYTGSVDDFYNPDAAVLAGQYTHEQQAGVVPADGTQLDYSVGFTNGNGLEGVSPGALKATLQFMFLYH